MDRRRCYNCSKSFPDSDLRKIKVEGTRRNFCWTCTPKDAKPRVKRHEVRITVSEDPLRRSMKLAMLRGLKEGLFSEEETLRALEKMA